ncbi:MAG: hypothetical protein AAF615_03170 [Pseudomonadota bacterium]
MAIHCVFISSPTKDSALVDRALRERFADVYRVGVEFWLVDSGHDADQVAGGMRQLLSGRDKLFVAVLTRDFVPILSSAARLWLTSPDRSWRLHDDGRGRGDADGPLIRAAA